MSNEAQNAPPGAFVGDDDLKSVRHLGNGMA